MGDWKRTIGFAVAIVAIGLSLFMPWWQIGEGGTSMSIKLREIEVCHLGACQEYDTGGAYGMVSVATFFYGIAAVLALIVGGLLPALANEPTKPMALAVSTLFLGFAGFTMMTLPDYVVDMMGARKTVWYWCAIGGPLAAIVAPIASMISSGRVGEGKPKLYRPPDVDELKRLTGDAPAPARTRPASIPMVNFAPVPGMAPIQPRPAPAAIAVDDLLPPPAAPVTIDFALVGGEVREDALIGIAGDGRRREVRWAEIGGAIARELRDEPPFEATLLVDLVPPGALPLRFVAATRLDFAAGDSGATDPRDQLRRLLAFARAMNPEIQLEGATADFIYKKAELPSWSLRDLAQYDARYRQLR